MSEWRICALSASKAVFRARTYRHDYFSPVMMITEGMKLESLQRIHDALLYSVSGMGSCICLVAVIQLDITRSLNSS